MVFKIPKTEADFSQAAADWREIQLIAELLIPVNGGHGCYFLAPANNYFHSVGTLPYLFKY